ncbi:unnamed protein product [Sphagnum jensenii]|uniref:Transposase n=1 Tax=Sphagnum jensenii TaxID=128206 RepID=A0ABP0VGR7_9BRYO
MWQHSYSRKYDLEVTEQEGAHVKATRCKFCKYYGRQVLLSNRKRGPRKTDQFYTIPFRTDLIVKHLEGQHTNKWAEYVASSHGEQDTFFNSVQPLTNTMYHYMDMEGDEINLVVSTEIVDVIIGEMLFRPEDELDALDDDDLADVVMTIEQTKNTCKIAKFGGLNDTIVGQYVRILVGHALQVISNILASDDVWAFAISFDGNQHRGTTFFDRHIAANQEAMLVKLLGALFVGWTRKLIGVTTDGEKTNMGRQRRTAHPDVVLVAANIRVRPSHRHNHRDSRETGGARFGDLPATPGDMFNIRDMFKVRHIDDEADGAFDDLPIVNYVCHNDSFVLVVTLRKYVDDLGTCVQAHLLVIDANEKMIILQTIARFAISLSDGIAKVEVERDPTNNAAIDLAPPVMPMDLVNMRSSTFISEVIETRKAQLQATAWTDDQINAIENYHRELLTAYGMENGISSNVDQHDHTMSFNEAWDSLDGTRFDQLCRFCAGLVTIFPNSTSVESDFSIFKWELEEFRKSLLDLSLERIFQAKQFELLDSIGCILTPILRLSQ